MPGDCHPTRTVLGQGEGAGTSRALDSGDRAALRAFSKLWAPRCLRGALHFWLGSGCCPLHRLGVFLQLRAPRSDSPPGHRRANTWGRCRWTRDATCQLLHIPLGQLFLGSVPLWEEGAKAVTHLSLRGAALSRTALEHVEKLGRRPSLRPSAAGP